MSPVKTIDYIVKHSSRTERAIILAFSLHMTSQKFSH